MAKYPARRLVAKPHYRTSFFPPPSSSELAAVSATRYARMIHQQWRCARRAGVYEFAGRAVTVSWRRLDAADRLQLRGTLPALILLFANCWIQ